MSPTRPPRRCPRHHVTVAGGQPCPVCRARSRVAQGYGAEHRALRDYWAPFVAAGTVDCHAPVCKREQEGGTRRIEPGERWDLGHQRGDRRQWSGPEHVRCNRATREGNDP